MVKPSLSRQTRRMRIPRLTERCGQRGGRPGGRHFMAAACGRNVEEVSDIVLARHVHTGLYDAYPGIPSPAGDQVVFAA